MDIINVVVELGGWGWLILAAVLVALDIAAPGLFLVWFGAAAGLTGLAVLAAPIPPAWQLVLFSALSVLSLIIGRTFFSPAKIETEQPLLNQRGAQLIGQTFTLEAPIAGGRGRITSGDVIWIVEGPDLDAGARVTVTGADGSKLRVQEYKAPNLPKAGSFGG
jgi:hypothetical protein